MSSTEFHCLAVRVVPGKVVPAPLVEAVSHRVLENDASPRRCMLVLAAAVFMSPSGKELLSARATALFAAAHITLPGQLLLLSATQLGAIALRQLSIVTLGFWSSRLPLLFHGSTKIHRLLKLVLASQFLLYSSHFSKSHSFLEEKLFSGSLLYCS